MVATSETQSTQRNIPAYPELLPNLIGGKSSIGRGERLPIFDPSTGEQIAELAEADEATVSAAVDNARTTFVSGIWSKAPVAERQAVMYQCAAIIRPAAVTWVLAPDGCSTLANASDPGPVPSTSRRPGQRLWWSMGRAVWPPSSRPGTCPSASHC